MLSFLADENFNRSIIKGLHRLDQEIDILRVQDTEIAEAEDTVVLDFALQQNRVLMTHDIKTIPPLVREQQSNGFTTPGVILIGQHVSIKTAIADLYMIYYCTDLSEWFNKTQFLPLPGTPWY